MHQPSPLILPALSAPVYAQAPAPTVGVWAAHRVVIPAASRVDLSHLGVHTHANYLLFGTGAVRVNALRADAQVRTVRIIAHCRLPTDHAALPPGFNWIAKDYGKIPTYGAIDGSPGWGLSAVFTKGGRNLVRFAAPTRFANWVAHQTPALQRRYKDRWNYSLEIDWQQRK